MNLLCKEKKTGLRFLWSSGLVLFLDWATKKTVFLHIPLHSSVHITGFFNVTHVHNLGAAFGFLHTANGWQRWFFSGVGVFTIALLFFWLKGTPRSAWLRNFSYSLIIGGALGNLFDRARYGFVIDFIDIHYCHYYWPAFNIADSAIFVGVLCLFFSKDPVSG